MAACLAGMLAGCGKAQPAQAYGPGAERPPSPVVVATVERRDVPIQITAIGNVEAYQTVQVRSMVNGQIDHVNFKEGQDVSAGQLLFTLDKNPFRADLDKAAGALKHDEAQAANSKLQSDRYTTLEKEGVVSHEQAEQMRTQARADASAVEADRAAVRASEVQLQYTDIKAPINARAGALMINLGNLVKANDTPFLVQLNQVTPIYVDFSIPEAQLAQVRQAKSGHLKVLAYPKGQTSHPSEGYLTFIDNGVDPQTATIKLKGTFTNQDRRLWPGEFVDVVVDLATRKNAIVAPTKAIQIGQQGVYVYVVTPQNTVQSRPVSAAGAYQDLTLVTQGLAAGERVVVDGQLRLFPNAKVMIQNAPSHSATVTVPVGGGE